MAKTKTVRMPAGIRTKLMAAIAMLLVSTIMMVSSTYAWFTLSTAPEVTGITTSVGANGNLEIALLNGQTYESLDLIGSGTGTSTAATGSVLESNITWGNLVDLSDAAYGLNLVALNPAGLNHPTVEGEGGTTTTDKTKVSLNSLLVTAEYGSDGRVTKLVDNTVAGIYRDAKWITTEILSGKTTPDNVYGVRAIGVDSNMSVAQIVLNAAKSAVNAGVNGGASNGVSSAVNANKTTFMTLAMTMNSSSAAYSADDVAALKAVADGVQSSLNTVVKTYSNAVLAKVATTDIDEDELSLIRTQLSNNVSASTLISLMNTANVTDTDYSARLNALATAQSEVKAVLTACGTYADGSKVPDGSDEDTEPDNDTTVAEKIKDEIVKPLIGTSVAAYGEGDAVINDISMGNITAIKSVYVTGGLVSDIAVETGTYQMTIAYEIPVYAGAKGATTGYLAEVATKVVGLTIENTDSAETTIADFYGYVIDFAFRTNAAESNLQLQTTPANRVYSNAEGSNLATQGAGSTATFAFDAAKMKADQVEALLNAVNLVFMSPVDGTIYATAKLTDILITNGVATADVMMDGQTGETATITALEQNVAKAVSVLVYLDGEKVDNGDVANDISSGMLNLNLQFSSSANLIPMENTALKNMVITYTELSDEDYLAGLYTYGGALYTVKEDYKIYNGSDGMVYFSEDAADYTKLTVVTANTALTPVTVSVSSATSNIVEKGSAIDLTAAVNGVATNASYTITWASKDSTIAAINGTAEGASINVIGQAAGNVDIEATVALKFTYTEESVEKSVTKSATVAYTVTVTADEDNTQQGGTTTYNVSVPAGVTGETTATAGTDYIFTVAGGYTLGEVTVGGNVVTPTDNTDGSYTIAGDSVTGNIVITATATATQQTPVTYAVAFDANYPTGATFAGGRENATDVMGSVTSDSSTYTLPDSDFTAPDNYTFAGWATTNNGAANAVGAAITLTDATTTLYAVWTTTTG